MRPARTGDGAPVAAILAEVGWFRDLPADRHEAAAEVEALGAGGLSGRPLTARSTEVVRRLRDRVGPGLTLVGVGGISSVEDARDRLAAGADLLQAYSAFVYEGPGWPRRLVRGAQA